MFASCKCRPPLGELTAGLEGASRLGKDRGVSNPTELPPATSNTQ